MVNIEDVAEVGAVQNTFHLTCGNTISHSPSRVTAVWSTGMRLVGKFKCVPNCAKLSVLSSVYQMLAILRCPMGCLLRVVPSNKNLNILKAP